jgi:hypothetical protein
VAVITINLAIVHAGTATYNAGSDTTSITVTFASLPNTALNIQYSTDLTSWIVYAGNPVSTGPTGLFSVTFSAPGNQTATSNSNMFFEAIVP